MVTVKSHTRKTRKGQIKVKAHSRNASTFLPLSAFSSAKKKELREGTILSMDEIRGDTLEPIKTIVEKIDEDMKTVTLKVLDSTYPKIKKGTIKKVPKADLLWTLGKTTKVIK